MQGTRPTTQRLSRCFRIAALSLPLLGEPSPGATNAPGNDNVIGGTPVTAAHFIRAQDGNQRGLFFNACRSSRANLRERYVLIVLPSAEHSFLFWMIESSGRWTVANAATLTIKDGVLSLLEGMGGEWTQRRIPEVANQL